MPTRIIRDGILTSERVDHYRGKRRFSIAACNSVVDDHGRFYTNPKLILAACFPLKIGKVSDSDIEKWLTACVTAALVRVYPASDGKRYIEILDFGQRIQSKSKFPEPSSNPQESTVIHGEEPVGTVKHRLVVVEDVVEDEGVKPRAQKRKKPETTPLPEAFGISESVKAWAQAKGHTRLTEHLEAFKSKSKAKGYAYADWDAAFQEAIRMDWAQLGKQPQSTVANGNSVAASRAL